MAIPVRRVILESPFAGTGWWLLRLWRQHQNVRYARACLRDSLLRGESPIASHLLYTQRGVLNDQIPHERKNGIDAGLAWKSVADSSVIYVDRGVSKGMVYGVRMAKDAGLPVEYRRLRQ